MAVSFGVDGMVSSYFQPTAWVARREPMARLVKQLPQGISISFITLILGWRHRHSWVSAMMFLTAALISGGFVWLLKPTFGRLRPIVEVAPWSFDFVGRSWSNLFHAKNLSFPSGHTCTAFAMAACLSFLAPRWAVLFYGLAVAVGLERVAELAHYPSDVVAAGGLGIIASHLGIRVVARMQDVGSKSCRVTFRETKLEQTCQHQGIVD